MSLKNKLSRLKPHLSVSKQEGLPVHESKELNVPYLEQWKMDNVIPYYFDQEYCLIREVCYPLSNWHGHYRFQDILTAVDIWNNQSINHPLSAVGHRPEDLFFFDTETTGLGGGVGNTIFILGYASVFKDQIVLRQHILPYPGAEVSLYQSFLEKINYKTLVTYNGKSFDWPQVKTRHTLVRDHVPKLPPFGHFDLYHAARRLWKHKLDRMKLAVVEKEVLGVERVHDIPGYLAPMIYIDFVESKRPDGMLGILKHNEIDILSLITLYIHLTFQLCSKDQLQTRKESFEVGKWFSYLGEQDEAEKIFSRLLNGTDLTSQRSKLALAFQYKKLKEWDKAFSLFKEVSEVNDIYISNAACVEAAKLLEHKQKNMNLAKHYCLKAINLMKQTDGNPSVLESLDQLQKRLNRLEKKCK